jgi:pimeloyl-ACP methyl ester carboxylesterase
MGGMIVYEYLRRWGAEEIASAVPIISTPAWTEMTEYIRRNEPRFDEVFSPELEQEVKEADPAEELLKLRDVPICMLNAVEDELMPIESVRRFYGRLKQNYSDASLLRLVTYPGHGHMTSEAMMKESVAWAKAHRPAANR